MRVARVVGFPGFDNSLMQNSFDGVTQIHRPRRMAYKRVLLLGYGSRLDDACGAQPGNLEVALAEEAAQHLIGVLTEQWRGEPVLDARVREAHGARDPRQLSCGGMLQLDADAARLDLRLLEYLRHVVDRAVRNAGPFEQLRPFPGAAPAKPLLQQPAELSAVFDALAVGGEARILRQGRASRRVAEDARFATN